MTSVKDNVYIPGTMAKDMKVSGIRKPNTDQANSSTSMVLSIMASMTLTKSMVRLSLPIRMEKQLCRLGAKESKYLVKPIIQPCCFEENLVCCVCYVILVGEMIF